MSADLEALSYRELQKMAKELSIAANQKKEKLIAAIMEAEGANGSEVASASEEEVEEVAEVEVEVTEDATVTVTVTQTTEVVVVQEQEASAEVAEAVQEKEEEEEEEEVIAAEESEKVEEQEEQEEVEEEEEVTPETDGSENLSDELLAEFDNLLEEFEAPETETEANTESNEGPFSLQAEEEYYEEEGEEEVEENETLFNGIQKLKGMKSPKGFRLKFGSPSPCKIGYKINWGQGINTKLESAKKVDGEKKKIILTPHAKKAHKVKKNVKDSGISTITIKSMTSLSSVANVPAPRAKTPLKSPFRGAKRASLSKENKEKENTPALTGDAKMNFWLSKSNTPGKARAELAPWK